MVRPHESAAGASNRRVRVLIDREPAWKPLTKPDSVLPGAARHPTYFTLQQPRPFIGQFRVRHIANETWQSGRHATEIENDSDKEHNSLPKIEVVWREAQILVILDSLEIVTVCKFCLCYRIYAMMVIPIH